MQRRDFILSCLYIAAGSALSKMGNLFKTASSFAESLPVYLGESPIPEKKAGVVENMQNGRLVLSNGSYNLIQLNDVGLFVWDNIDGKNTCSRIAHLMTVELGIDRKTASKDLKLYILGLKKEGFVVFSKVARCYAKKKAVAKQKP